MIHLKIFSPYEEVPKVGMFFQRRGFDPWLDAYKDGQYIYCISERLLPFIKELMELARKGEDAEMHSCPNCGQLQCTPSCKEYEPPPDPVSSAILKVGKGIIMAIGEHAFWTHPPRYNNDDNMKMMDKGFTTIAKGLEK